ncbi:hypothetical protein B0J12DRAFT_699757 [Macrophomina phaseolina]|uniref:Uncharacterized protein n=1 Tax=Macrophomina phaseolina TaxID=35725 RepID=A0ABQ8G957_9PEZI|nr:hypothetical protein B0J12DRAFT_699757 [Macrophomina phaseolina]
MQAEKTALPTQFRQPRERSKIRGIRSPQALLPPRPPGSAENEPSSRVETRREEKPLDLANLENIFHGSFLDGILSLHYGQQPDPDSFLIDERCSKCDSGTSCLRTNCAFVWASAGRLFHKPQTFNPNNVVHAEIMKIYTRLCQPYASRVKISGKVSEWWNLNTREFFDAIGIDEPGDSENKALSKAERDLSIQGFEEIKILLEMETCRKDWLKVDVLEAYCQVQGITGSIEPRLEGSTMLEQFFFECCHETSYELCRPEQFWRNADGWSFNWVIRGTLKGILESAQSDAQVRKL